MDRATDTDIQELKMAIDGIAKATDANTKAIEANAKAIDTIAKATDANTKAIEANARAIEANAKAIEANAKTIDTLAKATEANTKAIADLGQEMRLGFAKMETKIETGFAELRGEIKAIDTKLDAQAKEVGILQQRFNTNEANRSRLIAGFIGAMFATAIALIVQKNLSPEPPRNQPNRGATNYNLTTIARY
jgi:chromosome segregation ATPase